MIQIAVIKVGPVGLRGLTGKSAYQVAVEAGFEGTEQEWLDSLEGPQGPALNPPGPYADDLAALVGGVAVDQLYRKSSGTVAWRQKIGISKLALFGDSIIEQGGSGAAVINALGFWGWARLLGGSRWDPVRNGGAFDFATSGAKTGDLISSQLPALLISDATAMIDESGINDILQGVPLATTVANRVNIWRQCIAAGILPIALSITPIPLGVAANSGGALSALVVAANAALFAAAQAEGVPWCNYAVGMETVPGNGIADPIYTMAADNLHPSIAGAFVLGKALAEFLAAHFATSYDPLLETNWITPNVVLAGPSGSPTGWSVNNTAGGSITAKTTVEGGAYDWLEISVTGAEGSYSVANFQGNVGGSPEGKTLESVAEFEIISGAFWVALNNQVIGGTGGTWDNFIAAVTPYPLTAGMQGVLRAPSAVVGTGGTWAVPSFYFRVPVGSTGTIRVRRIGTRSITP